MSSLDSYDQIRVNKRRRRIARQTPAEQLINSFGAPPLLPGESEVAYLDLADRIRAALPPRDEIEAFLMRDVIDLTWHMHRLKSAYVRIVALHYEQSAISLIRERDQVTARHLDMENAGRAAINEALRIYGLTAEDVNARSYALNRDVLDSIERQEREIEARRRALLLDIEHRRDLVHRWSERERAMILAALERPRPPGEGDPAATQSPGQDAAA